MGTRENLPYLPELESVECKDTTLLPLLGMMVGILLFVIFTFVYHLSQIINSLEIRHLVMAGVSLFFLLYIVFRTISGYFFFETDANGLYMRGPFRKKPIRWADISGVSVGKTFTGGMKIIIEINSKTIKIIPGVLGINSSSKFCLLASIWQNLRRINGKTEIDIEAIKYLFWGQIPKDVPTSLEWGKQPSFSLKIGNILLWLTICFMLAYFLIALFLDNPWLGIFLIPLQLSLVSCLILEIRKTQRRAYFMNISQDGLDANLMFSKIFIPWQGVIRAYWREDLCIKISNSKHEVRIPYKKGNVESENLILAVIRRLRKAGLSQAVPLPQLISKDQNYFKSASGNYNKLVEEYLNTLEEPARKRLKFLYNMCIASVLMAIIFCGVIFLAGIFGKIIISLHSSGPQNLHYFFSVNYMLLGILMVITFPFLFLVCFKFYCAQTRWGLQSRMDDS